MPRRPSPLLLDGGLVLLTMAVGQYEAWTVDPEGSPRLVVVLCALTAAGALALRRRWPATAALLVMSTLLVKDAFAGPGELVTLLLCGVIATYSVGLRVATPRSYAVLGGLVALSTLALVLAGEDLASELLFSLIAIGGPWAAGRLVRASGERTAMVEELIASRERSRIARELHDLVGHSVSLMVIQAGAAEQTIERDPERARRSLQSLQGTGREAIEDLHRVLGLLRADTDADSTAPAPGLGDLDLLVGRVREAGVDVGLTVEGSVRALPEGLSLAGFRIVQEALTNVVRHAGPARVEVSLVATPDHVLIEVRDDGSGSRAHNPAGHGLVGIRERVAMFGGDHVIGPLPGGGFGVSVRLPYGTPA